MRAMVGAAGGWVCYVVECADGTLYTGITNALARRLALHNRGAASKYTRGRRPVRVVYAEACRDRGAASWREARIKKLPRAAKLALTVAPRRRYIGWTRLSGTSTRLMPLKLKSNSTR